MSLFGIFNRSRADRPDADAVSEISRPPNDRQNLHFPSALATTPAPPSHRPRTLALVHDADALRAKAASPTKEDFDPLNPPPFRDIFHLCVRIAPAHTCLARKGNAVSKPHSNDAGDEDVPPGAGLLRKLFALTKNGYILQYADRGPSGRLPERLQKLTPDTIAIASDLVPGQAYTLLVAKSADLEALSRPDQASFLSKFKSTSHKKGTHSTLIILDSPTQLEEWLTAIRKEVHRLSKPEPPVLDALPKFEPISARRGGYRKQSARGSAITVQVGGNVDIRSIDVVPKPGSKIHVADLDRVRSPTGPTVTDRSRQANLQVFPRSQVRPDHTAHPSKHTPRQDSASSIPVSLFIAPPSSKPNLLPPISLGQGAPHVIHQMPPADKTDKHRARKNSLAGQAGQQTGTIKGTSASSIHKRASLSGSARIANERPSLRSVSSFSNLRRSKNPTTTEEPVPMLPSTTYNPPVEAAEPEEQREGLRLENDEYHAFQQSMSDSKTDESDIRMENDEYHAFQQSLSRSPKRSDRSIRSRRHRFSGIPSPGTRQLVFNDVSPPRFVSRAQLHDEPHAATIPRPPSAASTAVVSIKSHFSTRTRTTMRSERPAMSASMRSVSEMPTSRTRKGSVTSQNNQPLAASRSMRSIASKATTHPHHPPIFPQPPTTTKRIPPPLHLAPPAVDSDSDDDDDVLVIQTNVEPLDVGKSWPKPPSSPVIPAPLNPSRVRSRSPISLPAVDLGLPVVALSPPPPPPQTPLPQLPSGWPRASP